MNHFSFLLYEELIYAPFQCYCNCEWVLWGIKLLASILQRKHYLQSSITQPQEKIEKKKKKNLSKKKNTDAETEHCSSLIWLIWCTTLRLQAMYYKISFLFRDFFFFSLHLVLHSYTPGRTNAPRKTWIFKRHKMSIPKYLSIWLTSHFKNRVAKTVINNKKFKKIKNWNDSRSWKQLQLSL